MFHSQCIKQCVFTVTLAVQGTVYAYCNVIKIIILHLHATQVVTNGFFSFGRPVVYYEPLLFPGGSQYEYLVAPFWADIDIEYNDGGEIFYQVQVHSKGNSSASDELLDEVSAFISSDQQTAFSGSWMLVATWDSVEMYEDENDYVSSPHAHV